MGLSRLAEACRKCPYVDACDHKRYANDIIWELDCYENILKNATITKEVQ